jgi:hypothetical protein
MKQRISDPYALGDELAGWNLYAMHGIISDHLVVTSNGVTLRHIDRSLFVPIV